MGNTVMKEIDNKGEKVNTAEIISFQSKLADAPSIKRKSYDRYSNDGGTLTERTVALNKAAELRTQLLQCRNVEPTNHQLSGFINYLRKQDKRILDMIFHLANLSDKKEMKFDELTISEQKQFINALNQIKALNALLPTHILMPI